jgi:HSP20 family protein
MQEKGQNRLTFNHPLIMRLVQYSYPAFRVASPSFARSPWSGLETEIDQLFESALSGLGGASSPSHLPVDLYEDKTNTYVRAELPGVNRDDITVEMTDGVLSIAATRKIPAVGEQPEQTTSLSRTVAIADQVQTDKISAVYENGVLLVTLPKQEQAQPKKITVAVK